MKDKLQTRRIHLKHTTEMGLVHKTYKEYFLKKRCGQTNSISKYRNGHKISKNFSTSLISMEKQIIRYHFITIRLSKVKKSDNQLCWQGIKQRELSAVTISVH